MAGLMIELQLQESVDRVRNGLAMCSCAMDAAITNETDYRDETLFAVRDSLASYISVLADVSDKLGNNGLAALRD